MLNFCTIFDSNYLSRGLAMYNSLTVHCPAFHLYVVCLDQPLYDTLKSSNYPNITLINLTEIETKYSELAPAKLNRSYVEYIFTLSPVIALYTLEEYPHIDMITTLDADLYFFSDPTPLFSDSDNYSIGITPHNFKKSFWKHIIYGRYNVSFQSFKNDVTALSCLRKWKAECIAWCYDRFENNKFADQKYLDSWIHDYPNVKEYSAGAGIAPWNILNKDVSLSADNKVRIKNETLIYYHFHGMRNVSNELYSLGLVDYRVGKRKKIVEYIYKPYITEKLKIRGQISNKIARRTHPQLGKVVYLLLLADLYYYRKDKLYRIYNFNFVRRTYSYLRSHLSNGTNY